MPTLSSTPTSRTAPPTGASAPASGSQVWNGNSGALIAKAMKKPRNSAICTGSLMSSLVEREEVERAGAELVGARDVEADDRREHEQAAEQAVEQELHRGVRPARPAVAADEEVHRDEHRLEEDVEQEDVGRREDADHHRLEQQHHGEEGLDARAGGGVSSPPRSSPGRPADVAADVAGAVDGRALVAPRSSSATEPPAGRRSRRGRCRRGRSACALRAPRAGRAVGVVPAGEQHDRDQDGDERDEHQRDAVDTDGVLDAEGLDPVVRLGELEARALRPRTARTCRS